jgi:hypothetical protein
VSVGDEFVLFAATTKGAGWTDWVQLGLAIAVAATAVAVPLTAFFRRPRLRLEEDVAGDYTDIAAGDEPRVRLLATNSKWTRTAYRTRVDVIGYRRHAETRWTWVGNLPLRWLGSPTDLTAAVYAGDTRPVELGGLFWRPPEGWTQPPRTTWEGPGPTPEMQEASRWHFHIAVAHIELVPDAWVIRLVIAAEDGAARRYDIDVTFADAAHNPEAALKTLQLAVREAG